MGSSRGCLWCGRFHALAGSRRAAIDVPYLADLCLRWRRRADVVPLLRDDLGLVADDEVGGWGGERGDR